MNKRGDIPVTILVVGVVGICVLAILSFSFSLGSGRTGLVSLSIIEDVLVVSEQISFYEEKGINFEVLMKGGSELHKKPNFYLRKNDEKSYSILEEFKDNKGLLFSVEYTFVP